MNFTVDYTIESPTDRCELVNDIVENNIVEISNHYKTYFDITKCSSEDKMCRQLEKMADYILYSEKRLESGILNRNRFKRLKQLDTISYEHEFREKKIKDGEESYTKQEKILEGYAIGQSKINNNRRFKKNKVTPEDYIKYPKLKDFLIAEWNLQKRIGRIEENNVWMKRIHKEDSWWLSYQDEIYQFRKALREVRCEKHQYKEYMVRAINFTRLGTYTTEYNFDYVFPYTFADVVDYEKFGDTKKQFYCLLELYSDLKRDSYGEVNADITHIISCFEDLIDSCNFEPYLFDILVWHIDDVDDEVIKKRLLKKYKLDYSLPWISQLYRHTILDKLFKVWQGNYEDWIYTYKLYGKWKKCSKCGEVKLATEKFFYKEKTTKDKLRPECKVCFQNT